MRDGMTRKKTHSDEKDMYGNYCGAPRPFLALGKRQKATEEEITGNPRARSATLRVAERQDTGKAKV
jgi:16S rRNA C1402 N4-methylase RsmH